MDTLGNSFSILRNQFQVVQSENNDPFTAANISNSVDGWYLPFFGVMDANIQ
jgi:hypothetical protein